MSLFVVYNNLLYIYFFQLKPLFEYKICKYYLEKNMNWNSNELKEWLEDFATGLLVNKKYLLIYENKSVYGNMYRNSSDIPQQLSQINRTQ